MGVELGHDMHDAVKLAATRKVVDELQQLYDNNHNRLNNLPEVVGNFESRSDASEPRSNGEPVQKDDRSDASEPASNGEPVQKDDRSDAAKPAPNGEPVQTTARTDTDPESEG